MPLYLSFGFEPIDELEVELPDGVRIDRVSMAKPIAALWGVQQQVSDRAQRVTIPP